MGAVLTHAITLEEYLSNPAYKHSEYVDGETVELNLGTKQHGIITGKCFRKFDEYLDQHPVGSAIVELHCKLQIRGNTRFRLPDVCVVLGPFEDRYLERSPDLCVEIRSPEDSIGDQITKFADYFANGCKLGWLILPEEQSVLVLTPGALSPQVAKIGDTLDGGEVLPGLDVPVTALFA